MEEALTDKYRFCNHHHEISETHEMVDFGNGNFVANKAAIPLLKALSDVGLITRTHHHTGDGSSFISIVLDNVDIQIRTINERDADRVIYNGKKELLISWDNK